MERTGGAFLLQETRATKLVGSLVSGIESSGRGWVQLTVIPQSGFLTFAVMADRVNAIMSRAIGMALISILHVLLAQIECMRSTAPSPPSPITTDSTNGLGFIVEKDAIRFSWDERTPDAVLASVEGQFELRVSEDFCRDFLRGLVGALGRFAVGDV